MVSIRVEHTDYTYNTTKYTSIENTSETAVNVTTGPVKSVTSELPMIMQWEKEENTMTFNWFKY